MSKEYGALKEETGEVAFLAGVVDVLSDILLLVCDSTSDFDADIFYIPNNDFAALDDAIKKRLKVYNQSMGSDCVKQKDIDSIHLELEKIEEDVPEYVYKAFQNHCSSKNLQEAIDEFFGALNWYLQKPVCIYRPGSQCSDHVLDILGRIYLYMAFDYFFIAYDEYMVLFVLGTTE